MRVISPLQSIRVPVERGRNVIELEEFRSYIMHDIEALSGARAGAFSQVDALRTIPDGPRAFDGAHEMRGELVVPFIGGMGDAISMIPVLRAIRRGWPNLTVHIATTPGPGEVFSLFAPVDAVRRYPLDAKQWAAFDWYLSMESVEQTQRPGGALPDTFAAAAGVELDDEPLRIMIPHDAAAQLACLPREQPLIGLATGDDDSPRSYPRSSRTELAAELSRGRATVVLFGEKTDTTPPRLPRGVIDLRNQTPQVLELAVWLSAMDAVIANDSFIMHLAGALDVPTIGLFAPTSPMHISPYAQAASFAATVPCAPCHEAGAGCPKGYDRCIGWDDESLAPAAVAQAALAAMRRRMLVA